MDIVITVCDNAAGETCPLWPGAPVSWHWPFADPAAMKGDEEKKLAIFKDIFDQIREAVDQFLSGNAGADIAQMRAGNG